jgi:hypothetical protein
MEVIQLKILHEDELSIEKHQLCNTLYQYSIYSQNQNEPIKYHYYIIAKEK